ncbi:MAG: MFS transporter [Methanomicrobiales archaeon]|nr:MFS transporter [Methanomicrobiales archaeon]
MEPGNQPGGDRSGHQRIVYYLFLIGFFAIFSTTISKNPVLPLYAHALQASDATLGIIAAVSPFAGIVFSFPVGVLSDRIGKRKLLIASGLVLLLAPLSYLLITSAVLLIPIRFFHGLGTAILGPVASAIIVERFPGRRGEMLGKYSSATLIGRSSAPLTGGIVISLFAFSPGLISYQAVYILAFLAAVPVFFLTLLYSDPSGENRNSLQPGDLAHSFRTFFGDRILRSTALVEMASYFSFGAFETFLPVYLLGKGFAAYEIGILFSVQVVLIALTKPLFGQMADRIDPRVQIVTGLFLMSGPVALIPLMSGFGSFIILSIITGLGLSLSTVATGSFIAGIARKKEIGASMGALSATMDIGHSLGPLVTGLVIGTGAHYSLGFSLGFLLAFVAGTVFVLSVYSGRDSR